MFRIARYGSLAAAILLMVVGASVVLFMDRGASPAFGQALKQVREARSISYTQTATSEDRQRPAITKELIAEDGRRRSELQGIGALGGITTIFDSNGFPRIVLIGATKTALVSPARGDRGINAGKMFAAWLQDL